MQLYIPGNRESGQLSKPLRATQFASDRAEIRSQAHIFSKTQILYTRAPVSRLFWSWILLTKHFEYKSSWRIFFMNDIRVLLSIAILYIDKLNSYFFLNKTWVTIFFSYVALVPLGVSYLLGEQYTLGSLGRKGPEELVCLCDTALATQEVEIVVRRCGEGRMHRKWS